LHGYRGSPLKIDSATYSRDDASAHVNVFATTTPGPEAAAPVLSVGDAAGTAMSSVLMTGPTALGQYYGQGLPPAAGSLPAAVIVINSADIPPSSLTASLVDEVTIIQAAYDPAGGTLTITATSSDKLVTPQLFAIGLPGSETGSDALTLTGGTDPPEQEAAFLVGAVPPATVTVISDAGGQDTEAVVTTAGGTFADGAPVAVDDNVSVEAGTVPSVAIDVLLNDELGADPNTVVIVSQGTNGTAVPGPGAGEVTYTFSNNTLVGDDTFTYTVMSIGGLESNVATVTVTTTAPTGGAAPIANPDGPFTVEVDATLQIPVADLLDNDLGNGGIIAPNSFAIVPGSVTGGVASVTLDVVVYEAGSLAGTFSFEYTVANTIGLPSVPALVTVTVNDPAPPEVITVQRAQFRSNKDEWRVDGTTTVPGPGNLIHVHVGNNINGDLVGTVVVDALGTWRLRPGDPNISPNVDETVTVHSSSGTIITVPLQVR